MGNELSPHFSIDTKSIAIGRGSYGTVYKARRDSDKFPCAAKVLHQPLKDPSNPDRLETTIRKIKDGCSFLERLKHNNIVQYLGVTKDLEKRSPVLLMELLPDAESLTRMLDSREKPLPYFTEVNICCDIASAVEYLHSKDVIIQNLSSNNVLVIAKMRAKVADFGMCRLNKAMSMNTTSSRIADLAYMPAEALEQQPKFTKKVDCFSQGVIMIQVCTRKAPDPGDRTKVVETNAGSMQALIPECERRQDHISLIQDSIRKEFLSIAKHCLKDKEDDRPTSDEIHNSLSDLKTAQEYKNSLESDYQQLWEDIVRHTRLLIKEEQMKEYTVEKKEAESEGNVEGETKVNVIEEFEQMLKKADNICILVVGTSGDGVSTLLNGLLGDEKCQSREIMDEFTVAVNTFDVKGAANVTVIDCRNLHSNMMSIDKNVNKIIETVKPHGSPDLIIYSQKMGENIDVVSQTKHKSVIARLTAGFANLDGSRAYKDIWKRCMFVLTFANEYEKSLNGEQEDKEKAFNRRWNEWMKVFKQTLHDSKIYVPMKVCIAGFKESKLHNSDHWLSDVWLTAFLTLSRSGALALLRINAFRFVKAALLSDKLHPAEQFIIIDQSGPLINSKGAAAGIGAAGAASAVTGAAIGGTIGAVGIGTLSFGVFAGGGLALGIALGSVVGLGVSGGVAAAVKRYRENKNFKRLPSL